MTTQTQDTFTATKTVKVATDKQRAFIVKLLGERDLDADVVATLTAEAERTYLSSREASIHIDVLLAAPKATAPAAPAAAALEPGMYQRGVAIYKVQRSRTTGGLYAKRLVGGEFEYAPGAMRDLTADDRMTAEQAAAYGRETGMCCVCSRELTNPESVAAGIGPICAGRL